MTRTPTLHDRRDAGVKLAERMHHLADKDPVLLGISGGGVTVGAVVAEVLGLSLDILSVDLGDSTRHRIAATSRMRDNMRETGFLNAAGNTSAALDALNEATLIDLGERHVSRTELPDVLGRTVVLVDDGLHPDTMVHAALRALKSAGASTIVLATPFLSESSAALHESELDELIALEIPLEYGAATEFYDDPTPPTLAEVKAILARFAPRKSA